MDKIQVEQLKKKIDQAEIVSFDLYDTLIFRKTRQQQDIFVLTEFYIGSSGFARRREKVQITAARYVRRKYGWPHPNLHEIYKFWSRSDRTALLAEKAERELEECLAVRNHAMYQIMRYARERGRRIIITSDMYMEKFQIEKILKACAVTDWDAVYVSSEIRKTKYEGTIYDFIIEKENTPPGRILHIGDDRHSDVLMAGRKGIHTYWYQDREADLAESLHKSSSYKQSGTDISISETETGVWYNLGYQIGGPLYMGLILWLKETVGNKKLFCLSRDGYNLSRLLPQFGMPAPKYIYASRRALLLPHITKIGPKELELLPPYSCGQTAGEILNYLGLENIPETEIRKAGFVKGYGAVIRNKSDIARFKRMLKKNEQIVLEVCQQERINLEKYFETEDMFRTEVYFFDSGWSGTSQYLLQKIYQALYKKCSIRFCYAGIKKNAVSADLLKGCRWQDYFDTYMDKYTLNKLLASSAVLELFFSEDAPAVECYGKSGIQFEAYQKRDYIRCINQGINDYLSQNRFPAAALSEEAARRYGVHNLVRLVLSPDSREAECIGNIENIDRMSAVRGMKKYIAKIPEKTLRANPFWDIYWEQGVYRHPHNTWYVKAFVWLRQRTAVFYRAVRRRSRKFYNIRR